MTTPIDALRTPDSLQPEYASAVDYLLTGIVQGVGFRPFVYRLAHELGISGWVENRTGQVAIHVEGPPDAIGNFERRLLEDCPPHAIPEITRRHVTRHQSFPGFEVRNSQSGSEHDIHILADLPVCDQCLVEMNDSRDRRYRYPFINCTECGPRYSIIRQLPYDRRNTTMSGFPLCPDCLAEYTDPTDRRFHAEPIACPSCGPGLVFDDGASPVTDYDQAISRTVETLQAGSIVAVKGIGGYHLMCDARNDKAVATLRKRKPRPDKPLAIMLREQDLNTCFDLSADERDILSGPVHPVLLLKNKPQSGLSALLAPGLDRIGVMLPYSPLHHLLLQTFDGPLVATSANISGEPILTDGDEVNQRLSRIIDASLHHNRPVARPADDPVYHGIRGKLRPVRPGRGQAPCELRLPVALKRPVLAVGGHMKNTIALAWNDRLVMSPHIGDLESPRSLKTFGQVINDLQNLYQVKAEHIICDSHTGYGSYRWASRQPLPFSTIFHHHAHAGVVAGEYPHEERWLVFTWDGVGLGPDQTLWGGEALIGQAGQWQRSASMRPFRIPGGDKAARQPWRSAAALRWELGEKYDTRGPGAEKLTLLHEAWRSKLNSPQTSSVGRLFDAAASLTNLVQHCSFEGQAPLWLEALARSGQAPAIDLPLQMGEDGTWRTDWSPLITMLGNQSVSAADRAYCFHESLAAALLQQAQQLKDIHGDFAVGLAGGVFQNVLLTERVMALLEQHGFRCYLPERVPVNDAGLCVGQVIEYAASQLQGER